MHLRLYLVAKIFLPFWISHVLIFVQMSHCLIWVIVLIVMSDSDSSDEEYEHHQELMLHYANILVYTVGAAALYYGLPLYGKTPYHTSALTGADWARKLLNGHP